MSLLIKKEKLREYWLYFLIMSFAYEKPLYFLTNMDRVNPRLFDVVAFLGILLFGSDLLKKNNLPRPIMYWKWLVIWFSICAIIWAVFFFKIETGLFSLFFAYRYLLGLITLYFVWNIEMTSRIKKNLYHLVIIGGVFVSIYSLFEILNPVDVIEIAPGKFFHKFGLVVFGPFSVTYFHIAQFSGLAFIFTLVYSLNSKKLFRKSLYLLIALFNAWPLFFCGSRTALAYFFSGLLLVLLFDVRYFKRLIGIMVIPIFFVFMSNVNVSKYINVENSLTIQRLVNTDNNSSNSVGERISLWEIGFSNYEHYGLSMPFIGSGFYVVPVNGNNRIGFGIHNIYLFVFEHSGLIGFVLFIFFLFTMIKSIRKINKRRRSYDKIFAYSALIFFISTLILGIVGQIFWRGFVTSNMNSYILTVLFLAIIPSRDEKVNPTKVE